VFQNSSEARAVQMTPAITRRTLTFGDSMLLVEFTLEAGAIFPAHSHPYEQIGYLCRGSGKLWIGEESFDLGPGSSWCIPADVPHRAEFLQDSIAIDVFSPVRDDYRDA
jgi:quercetin dioxygenase-like cupin family protein